MVSTSLYFYCSFFIYVLYFFCIHSLLAGLLAFFMRSPPAMMRTQKSGMRTLKCSAEVHSVHQELVHQHAWPGQVCLSSLFFPSVFFSFFVSLPSPPPLFPFFLLPQSTSSWRWLPMVSVWVLRIGKSFVSFIIYLYLFIFLFFSFSLKWGEVRWGEVRWGEVRWGEVRWGEVRWGEVRWGEVRWGEVRWGEVRWGEMRWGEVRWGEIRWGCRLVVQFRSPSKFFFFLFMYNVFICHLWFEYIHYAASCCLWVIRSWRMYARSKTTMQR